MTIRPDKLADYQLSQLQDDVTAAIETLQSIEARLLSLLHRIEEIKRVNGMPLESYSMRDKREFVD